MALQTYYYVAVAPDGTPIVIASRKRNNKFAVVMLRDKEEEGLRHWMVFTAQPTEDAAQYKARMYAHDPAHSDTPCFVVPLGRLRWTGAEPEKLRRVIPSNGAKALS